MKFSFVDLDGKTFNGECTLITHDSLSENDPLKIAIKNSTALSGVLGEFNFFKLTHSDQTIPASGFAVDNENNVFHSDKLPDFVQIGTHWKATE